MPETPVAKPDIAEWHHAAASVYYTVTVKPYLQQLLDTAQRKLTRHRLKFTSYYISKFLIDDEETEFSHQLTRDQIDNKLPYHRRFPELVEFMRVLYEVDEILKIEVTEMEPTRGSTVTA